MFASLSLYLPLWVHIANSALYSIWSIAWEDFELDQIHNAEGSSGDEQLVESSSPPSSTSLVDANLSSEPTSEYDSETFTPPRSSHSRKKQDGYIRRPPNAFLIFRSEVWTTIKNHEEIHERNNRDISCIAGRCWRDLSDDEREKYRRLAAAAKEEHKKKYPHYKFCPVAKGKGGKRRTNEDVQARNLRAKAVARRLLESRMAKAESDAVDDDGERSGDRDEPDMSHNIRGGPPAQKKGKRSSKGKARAAAQRRYETPEPASPPSPLSQIEPLSPGLSSLPALSSPSSQNSSPPSSPELRERSPVVSEYRPLLDEAGPSNIADSEVRAHLTFRHSYADGATQPMLGFHSILSDEPFARPQSTLDDIYPSSKEPSSTFNFSPVVGSAILGDIDDPVARIDDLYAADLSAFDSSAWWGNDYDTRAADSFLY